jgi:uncharacterized phage-associated protein
MQYRVFDIANWFLSKEHMTHKKLQKICYYAVAWGFALLDSSITTEPLFEAWVHGPVSPLLYQKYKSDVPWLELKPDDNFKNNFDGNTEHLLESVWLTYGEDSGYSLEVSTHLELPWIKARSGRDADEHCNNPIDIDDMKEYYRSIYAGGDA